MPSFLYAGDEAVKFWAYHQQLDEEDGIQYRVARGCRLGSAF